MRDAINLIQEYIAGFTLETFEKDHKTWDAVVKEIEVIGEAVTKIEDGFKLNIPEIPWKQMTATRNKLVHDYWDINPKRVWEIANTDIPNLKNALLPVLEELHNSDQNHQSQ